MKFAISVLAAVCALAALSVPALSAPGGAAVVFVPANSNPPVPAGLKVTCLTGPDSLQSSKTCPVVQYNGYTTWAYSYIDNRVSLALVTYDSKNNVVRNVEQKGVRYIWNEISSNPNQNVLFFGQSNGYATVPWSQLGAP
jgi:hypothetical protein